MVRYVKKNKKQVNEMIFFNIHENHIIIEPTCPDLDILPGFARMNFLRRFLHGQEEPLLDFGTALKLFKSKMTGFSGISQLQILQAGKYWNFALYLLEFFHELVEDSNNTIAASRLGKEYQHCFFWSQDRDDNIEESLLTWYIENLDVLKVPVPAPIAPPEKRSSKHHHVKKQKKNK